MRSLSVEEIKEKLDFALTAEFVGRKSTNASLEHIRSFVVNFIIQNVDDPHRLLIDTKYNPETDKIEISIQEKDKYLVNKNTYDNIKPKFIL